MPRSPFDLITTSTLTFVCPCISLDIHSELKWQIRLGNYSWGYNAQIFHFCLPLDFLGAKDFKKIVKGRQRSERPNQRPDTGEFKF